MGVAGGGRIGSRVLSAPGSQCADPALVCKNKAAGATGSCRWVKPEADLVDLLQAAAARTEREWVLHVPRVPHLGPSG